MKHVPCCFNVSCQALSKRVANKCPTCQFYFIYQKINQNISFRIRVTSVKQNSVIFSLINQNFQREPIWSEYQFNLKYVVANFCTVYHIWTCVWSTWVDLWSLVLIQLCTLFCSASVVIGNGRWSRFMTPVFVKSSFQDNTDAFPLDTNLSINYSNKKKRLHFLFLFLEFILKNLNV